MTACCAQLRREKEEKLAREKVRVPGWLLGWDPHAIAHPQGRERGEGTAKYSSATSLLGVTITCVVSKHVSRREPMNTIAQSMIAAATRKCGRLWCGAVRSATKTTRSTNNSVIWQTHHCSLNLPKKPSSVAETVRAALPHNQAPATSVKRPVCAAWFADQELIRFATLPPRPTL